MTVTLAAQISATGIVAPDYSDILAQLQSGAQSIFGSDIVLTPDSQDGQLLAIFAQAIYDANQTSIAVYNSFDPGYAQGAGLSSVVKINGIARDVATNSTAVVSIVGPNGTIITNGLVGDNLGLGTQWALPASVTIPIAGTIDVTATCTALGAVAAAPGTLTNILTPTRGWQSVANAAAAAVGAPVEDDATLRQRQAISTTLPAETIVSSIWGNVANIPGVQSVSIEENDTGATDGNGVPGHSISAVVLGGSLALIAQAIANSKAPGTGTYGTTSRVVVDPSGVPVTINFYQLAQIRITVVVTITPLVNYASTTGALIQAAVAGFINSLGTGVTDYLSRLWAPANLSGDAAVAAAAALAVAAGTLPLTQAQLDVISRTYAVTAIAQARSGSPAPADVAIAFYEQAVCAAANVTVATS